VEHRGVLTLVDAGARGDERKVRAALAAVGRRPRDVRQIILTHSHGDHAGGALAARNLCQAPVYAGSADIPTIAGRAPYAMAPAPWGRALSGWLSAYPRFEVDHPVDGIVEVDGGLRIIPAPGHTAGHVTVHAPDLETLFVGDTVWNLAGFRPSWKAFTQDPERNAETVRELSRLPAEALHFGHGPSIRRGGRDRLRALVG
jgi:glyoxylase-like metal-dependent hydrolase (beta-lactamase superfamily II)